MEFDEITSKPFLIWLGVYRNRVGTRGLAEID